MIGLGLAIGHNQMNIKCLTPGCDKEYSKPNSLTAHCRRKEHIAPVLRVLVHAKPADRWAARDARVKLNRKETRGKCPGCDHALSKAKTLRAWKRHQGKFPGCGIANEKVKHLGKVAKAKRHLKNYHWAQEVLDQTDHLPEPGTTFAVGMIKRANVLVSNPVAHNLIYKKHVSVNLAV